MSDTIDLFRQAIADAGIEPPDSIEADGLLHRFSTNGRSSDKSGWYMLHLDGVAAGGFGCWRAGLQSTWCAKASDTMTDTERAGHRGRIRAMKAQRETEQVQRHQQGRETAAALWRLADLANTAHAYLAAKGVQPHGIRSYGACLLIPLRDTLGTLHSLQTITPGGHKQFHPGGRVVGCYYAIGQPVGVLVVCEGFATGASIHEATGYAVAVAFNAGNLQAVAIALHTGYPAMRLIVAADDDWRTEGNPGRIAAAQAALSVGGSVAVPLFPADRPPKATDFNDLHQLAGLEAVRILFEELEVSP